MVQAHAHADDVERSATNANQWRKVQILPSVSCPVNVNKWVGRIYPNCKSAVRRTTHRCTSRTERVAAGRSGMRCSLTVKAP